MGKAERDFLEGLSDQVSTTGGYPNYVYTTNKQIKEQFAQAGYPSSYAGVDIKAVVNVTPYNTGAKGSQSNDKNNRALANLQTITISTFREEFPVRCLGQVYPQGYTNGTRTVAGTMIFTVFDKQVLTDLMLPPDGASDSTSGIIAPVKGYENYLLRNESIDLSDILVDQLPPFDVTIVAASENGQISRCALYGVKINAQGLTMSVQDIITETTVNYTARRFEPMKSITNVFKTMESSSRAIGLKREFDYIYSQFKAGIITMEMYMRLVSQINQQLQTEVLYQNISDTKYGTKTFTSIIREDSELQKMLRLSDNPFI